MFDETNGLLTGQPNRVDMASGDDLELTVTVVDPNDPAVVLKYTFFLAVISTPSPLNYYPITGPIRPLSLVPP